MRRSADAAVLDTEHLLAEASERGRRANAVLDKERPLAEGGRGAGRAK